MFNRFLTNFCLIVLFVFSQTGTVLHEIEHFEAHQNLAYNLSNPESQPDNESELEDEICGHCIALEQSTNAVPTSPLEFADAIGVFHFSTINVARLVSRLTPTYSARAPPFSLS